MPVKSGGDQRHTSFSWASFDTSSSLPLHFLFTSSLETETTSASLLLHALKLVRDLLVRLEELGRAPVQADGFAFAEVAFAVGLVDAF